MLAYPSSARIGPLARSIGRHADIDLVSPIREQTGGEKLAAALVDELHGP